jgi:hypothetical protein
MAKTILVSFLMISFQALPLCAGHVEVVPPTPSLLQKILFPEYGADPEEPRFDSLNVRIVGRSSYGFFHDVALDRERNLVFATTGDRLYVFDVRDPTSLVKLVKSPFRVSAKSLFHADGFIFLACGEEGVKILDVSDPASPLLVGDRDTPGYAMDICVSGTYAYVADWSTGLLIVSIADPEEPTLVGGYDKVDLTNSVTVSDGVAYVTNGSLNIFDVTDPYAPALLAIHETSGWALDVALTDTLALVADGASGLEVIDVAHASRPEHLGQTSTFGYSTAVESTNGYAFVADWDRGFRIISVANPLEPEEVGYLDTPGYTKDVAVIGSYAYVADEIGGLRVISTQQPSLPEEAGFYSTPLDAKDVAVSGDYAYIADGEYGMKVLSIADPTDPLVVGCIGFAGDAQMIAVTGSLAIVFDGDLDILRIVSVEDPARPDQIGFYSLPVYYLSDLDVLGSYVYACEAYDGLEIVSVETPAVPIHAGIYYRQSSFAEGLSIEAPYAYLAGWGYGLSVLSIEDPAAPAFVGSCDLDFSARDIAIQDDFAYPAGRHDIRVISIADPSHPYEITSYADSSAEFYSIAAGGSYLYLVTEDDRLLAISIADPYSPVPFGYYTPGYSLSDVEAHGPYAYLPIDRGGLLILECFIPTAIDRPSDATPPNSARASISQNYPNPFNPLTMIEVVIPEGPVCRATLSVHDMRGRLVKRILQGALEPGRHRYVWDGTGENGGRVASGVYFSTLEHCGKKISKKMILAQ